MYYEVTGQDIPEQLSRLHAKPKRLYACSDDSQTLSRLMRRKRVAVVGSRRMTAYGHDVTHQLVSELAAHGVVIVSGLALGIDAAAHKAALQAGGLCLAVLPGSVQDVQPSSNQRLAQQIVRQGGALVSEYPKGMPVMRQNFVVRNRIVAGLADALLIVEATENSGTLTTNSFAQELGMTVYVVPGNITSPTSYGTNNLIKTGAVPVTQTSDILLGLGFTASGQGNQRVLGANAAEQCLLDLIEQGVSDGSQLQADSGLTVQQYNHHLTMLELAAKIRPLGADQWGLR